MSIDSISLFAVETLMWIMAQSIAVKSQNISTSYWEQTCFIAWDGIHFQWHDSRLSFSEVFQNSIKVIFSSTTGDQLRVTVLTALKLEIERIQINKM